MTPQGIRKVMCTVNIHAFFISSTFTFISNARLKLAENQTNANQHPVAEHTGIPGLWTQELDAGLWTLDCKHQTLHAGLWKLISETWTPDAERQAVDVKTFTFKTVQSFGNNGSMSITSFINSSLIKIFGHFRYEKFSTVTHFRHSF